MKIQAILRIMIVGKVFTVDDHTNAMLVPSEIRYSHHIEIPQIRPGIIMMILIMKAKNSTVLGLFQYPPAHIVFRAIHQP
jgi:hypothetical protein